MKTYQQVLDSATELAQIGDVMRATGLGSMLCAKNFRATVPASAPIFRLRDLGLPALRAGSFAKVFGSEIQFVLKNSFSFAVDVPSTGLSIGAGNAEVRIAPKNGWRVRYCQFNPGGPAATGTFFNASYSLKVFTSVWGDIMEIWVALGNDASAAINSTAAQVVAAIKANSEAMQALATVDNGAGTGANTAVASPSTTALADRPSLSEKILAGAGVDPQLSVGTLLTSMDGNLVFGLLGLPVIDFQGMQMPKIPLDMPFPSSAV